MTTLLGLYLIVVSVLLIYFIYELWPPGPSTEGAVTAFGKLRFDVSRETRIILIVLVVGGLGSYIQAAVSFVTFTGHRRLYMSWIWWYILRPFTGPALALIFYFAFRGGLLSTTASTEDISLFGVAAISGLVGMFSRQAIDKLSELFNTLFRTEQALERGDSVRNPIPVVTSIEPSTVQIGSDTPITLTGNNFLPESVIRLNGADLPTTFVNEIQLTTIVAASALASPGSVQVTVNNPAPGGGTSNTLTITAE